LESFGNPGCQSRKVGSLCAEGKYSEAFSLYERARQTYTGIYGADATEVADTLEGEAELYKSLND
jgi:hypothetical protein